MLGSSPPGYFLTVLHFDFWLDPDSRPQACLHGLLPRPPHPGQTASDAAEALLVHAHLVTRAPHTSQGLSEPYRPGNRWAGPPPRARPSPGPTPLTDRPGPARPTPHTTQDTLTAGTSRSPTGSPPTSRGLHLTRVPPTHAPRHLITRSHTRPAGTRPVSLRSNWPPLRA
jgi:hypothetical protein